ncbi:MAG: DNA-3-methyladenine glycosylase [Desulfobacteraceae bacterium]|nr:DNA-3-methyladenine glycosylase [Desulfobacteraceae bacterium]
MGKLLVRELDGHILSGIIIETEAYIGTDDTACHASKGRTPRNSVMFGMAGIAYIYFVYGMHYMLNVVTEAENHPCAVLIRAIHPIEGQEMMKKFRNNTIKHLTDRPAKLTRAMAIDKFFNGWDMTQGHTLRIEEFRSFPDSEICTGPRIGIQYAAPKDKAALWRFRVKGEYLP